MMKKKAKESSLAGFYCETAISHLVSLRERNHETMEGLVDRLVRDVKAGRSLFVFGSGHSSIFPMELYHRAGGASFVIPIVGDYLLPTAGPPVVRAMERTPGVANTLLSRVAPKKGEMIWIASQSGINGAVVDLALDARKRGLYTVAFTSLKHSQAVESRHPSKKRLFEACHEYVDLGGFVGDASIELSKGVRAGPVSSLGALMLANAIVVGACEKLERAGRRCVYTSVNTPEGEKRNRRLEEVAARRDPLLR